MTKKQIIIVIALKAAGLALMLVAAALVSGCLDPEPAPVDAEDPRPAGTIFVCRGGGPEERVCAVGPTLERLGWECRPTPEPCFLDEDADFVRTVYRTNTNLL